LQNGQARQLFTHASPTKLAALEQITRGSFTTALNHILLVAGIIAIVCGVLSFVLIRQKDFVQHDAVESPPAA
jgi:hypothetical protein